MKKFYEVFKSNAAGDRWIVYCSEQELMQYLNYLEETNKSETEYHDYEQIEESQEAIDNCVLSTENQDIESFIAEMRESDQEHGAH